MKKVVFVLVIVMCAFSLTGCFGPTSYDEISYTELDTMIKDKEDFVIMFGAESCSACKAFKPTLEKVIKNYKLDIKYLDVDKLSDDDYSKLIGKFYFTGTPTTVFVQDGKEADTHSRIEGAQKYSKVVKKLKEQGYIKE